MTLVITYRATNQNNGHWYVGSTTTSLERRKCEHLNSKQNLPFQNSLRKNPEAFKWEVLDESEEDTVVRSHEQYVLDGWHGTEYCYNLNPKAMGCTSEQASERLYRQRENPEFVALVGESVSKRNREKWKDEEYRNLMSNAVKKKWEDPDYKQYRSDLSRGTVKKLWEDEDYRAKQKEGTRKYWDSDENREKASKTNRLASVLKKRVKLTSLESGESYFFASLTEAAETLDLCRAHIGAVARGERRQHKGYIATYL